MPGPMGLLPLYSDLAPIDLVAFAADIHRQINIDHDRIESFDAGNIVSLDPV